MTQIAFKKPPFTIDRSRHGGLAIQLADALRRAIQTGYYRPGELLPPIRELAALTGVSQVITTRAIRILKMERIISPRPHVGCVVCNPDRLCWKGQILVVVPPGCGNQAENEAKAALRDTLTSAGYLVIHATVPFAADGSLDFSLLDTMTKHRFDLVVQVHDLDEVSERLASVGMPFIRVTRKQPAPFRALVGTVALRDDLCLSDFIAHCRESGVRNVLQITGFRGGPDAVPALNAAGIHAEDWRIAPTEPPFNTQSLSTLTALAFAKRLSEEWAPRADGRRPLPDLIFFRDDHLASGAMLVLASAGVRIPQDVRIVTWANKEDVPASVVPLTRMERDNAAIGAQVAKHVVDYLATGVFPADVTFGPSYVRGETV